MGSNRTGKNLDLGELMLSLFLQADTTCTVFSQAPAGYTNTFLESLKIHTLYLPHLGCETEEIKPAKNQNSRVEKTEALPPGRPGFESQLCRLLAV